MSVSPSSRRDQLLETATELFYRNGCHTTGIDKVLAEAGVAKMTLYKHFKSKENLVLAAAERLNERLREEFEAVVQRERLAPRERLLVMLDFLDRWCRREDFCGCPLINLAVQYPDPEHPIHRAAAEHKRFRIRYVAQIAREAGVADPEGLAARVVLVIEGATVLVQVTRDLGLVAHAREAVRLLVDQALRD